MYTIPNLNVELFSLHKNILASQMFEDNYMSVPRFPEVAPTI